jgi:hypothetical protein
VHAGALDEALDQRWLQLNALVHVLQGILVVAPEVAEGSAHVIRKSLVLAQVSQLESAVKGSSSLGVALSRLGAHGLQALAQLSLTALLVELGVVVETGRGGLGAEALQVVCDKSGAGQLLLLGGEDGLALGLGDLLQQALDALGAALVAEAVDDTAGRVVEESFAVALDLLVGVGAAVQGLDVLVVEVDGGGRVLDNLVPVGHGIVAGGAVRVENRVLLAEDGLAIEFDSAVVVLGAVCLVAGSLELGGVVLALLRGVSLGALQCKSLNDIPRRTGRRPSSRRLRAARPGVLALPTPSWALLSRQVLPPCLYHTELHTSLGLVLCRLLLSPLLGALAVALLPALVRGRTGA